MARVTYEAVEQLLAEAMKDRTLQEQGFFLLAAARFMLNQRNAYSPSGTEYIRLRTADEQLCVLLAQNIGANVAAEMLYDTGGVLLKHMTGNDPGEPVTEDEPV